MSILSEGQINILDDLNAKYGTTGRLCIYCGTKEYNSTIGIVHKDSCLLKQLREPKAQNIHSRQELIKELEEDCTEHNLGTKTHPNKPEKKKDCPLCWAKIKREITGG